MKAQIVGGASTLFDVAGNFEVVSAEIGVGMGFSPVDFYVAVQRQVAVPLALQQGVATAQGAGSFSLNWDDVDLVPRHDLSCWAAAAAMLIGWRDQVSINEGAIAAAANRIANQRRPILRDDVLAFAGALDLVAEEPMSWSEDGFRGILATCGPVWICKQAASTVASGHAVLVVGIYSAGGETYLLIADPWDRVVGRPGAPGPYLSSHAAGSR